MSEPAVVLQDVVRRAGGSAGLGGVSATIGGGQLVAIVGPDGAGKTTLLRLVAGLLRPDSGRIEVFGHDVLDDAAAVQAMIGYVPQRSGLYEDLTVVENLGLHAELRDVRGMFRRARFEEILGATGLGRFGDCRARALSPGMHQKLALACAVIAMPRLLLLDEPTAGLDPAASRELFGIAQSLTAEGMTVLWSTSRFDEAERCPHVVLLNEGRIIGQGTPVEIGAGLAGRVHAVRAIGGERRQIATRLRGMPGVRHVRIQGTMVRFLADAPGSVVPSWGFADIGRAHPVAPRLEDGFIALVAADAAPAPASSRHPVRTGASGPAIEVRALHKRFGSVVAVESLSLAVAPGEIFGLVGPGRAGKTVVLRMLCGLLSSTAGEARVAGLDLRTAPAKTRARVGYMGQEFSLYGELSVAQNLRFLARVYNIERRRRRDRVARLIDEFGLGPYAGARSGGLPAGIKRRLALAASLMHEPDIVLLDEPTAGIDPLERCEIWRHIEAIAAGGAAVLVASQSMKEAESCDRLLLIDRGHAVAAGRPDELMAGIASASAPEPTLEDVFIAHVADWERRHAA